jgi:hypothetical protein
MQECYHQYTKEQDSVAHEYFGWHYRGISSTQKAAVNLIIKDRRKRIFKDAGIEQI